MGAVSSQITGVSIICSTVCSGTDQRKHQTPRHWPLWGNPPVTHEFPAQRASNAENVPIDDVIMVDHSQNLVSNKESLIQDIFGIGIWQACFGKLC